MDSREAKEVLSSVRLVRDEAADPLVARALEQARRDPELARWWERQREIDRILSEKLRTIEVPPFLESRILSAERTLTPIRWWKVLAGSKLIAPFVAAAVVIVGLWPIERQPTAFAAYRSEMVAAVSAPYDMDVGAEDFNGLRPGFAKSGWPSDYQVSSALQGIAVEGGLLRTWRGKKVSVLCLETERAMGGTAPGASDEEDVYVWLFVMDRSVLPDLSATGTAYEKVGDLMTVAWTHGNTAYLLAADGDESSLRALR